MFFEKSQKFLMDFSSGWGRKRRVWGGNPNKIPTGQNERTREFWHRGRILLLETDGLCCAGFPLIPSTLQEKILPT